MNVFDPHFWARHFQRVFVSEIRAFERAMLDRVLPAFDGIANDAEAVANEEYERLCRLPGRDDVDMSDLAESAQEAGIAKYEELSGVRQAVLNLAAAALYHLVEQQLLLYHRRQVLQPAEEDDSTLFAWRVIHARFAEGGVVLKDLSSWPGLHELECVANVVKHGDGRSADELRGLRPEILVHEMFRDDPRYNEPTSYVRTPLTGDSVHVTAKDFHRYADIAVAFWKDLGKSILQAG